MQIPLKKDVLFILEELEKNDQRAYLVGGSIRDFLIGRECLDYDITTSASVEQMEEIFSKYKIIDIGKEYGNLKISVDGTNYIEVTTFRKEGAYLDYRHPSEMEFVASIEQDMARRDFTINALAYSKDGEWIDLFDGVKDIERRLVRTIGEPSDRFVEDPLRMMRAVRFCAQLDFFIEERTFDEMKNCASMIKKVSKERIRDELNKILLAPYPSKAIRLLCMTGLLQYVIPDLDKEFYLNEGKAKRESDFLEYTLSVLPLVHPVLELRLSAFLYGITNSPVTENSICKKQTHLRVEKIFMILKDLRHPKTLIRQVVDLVRGYDMSYWNLSDVELKKMMAAMGLEGIHNVMRLREAIGNCEGCQGDFEERVNNILHNKEPVSKSEMRINGYDLIEIGFEGIDIGKTLELLYEEVLENSTLNQKECLYQRAIEIYKTKV